MFSLLEKINLAVAIIALLLAIYSIIYTHFFNRININIENAVYESIADIYSVTFLLVNYSTIPLTIENIELVSSTGKRFINQPPSSFPYETDNLQTTRYIQPYSDCSICVCLTELNNPLIATIHLLCKFPFPQTKKKKISITMKPFY